MIDDIRRRLTSRKFLVVVFAIWLVFILACFKRADAIVVGALTSITLAYLGVNYAQKKKESPPTAAGGTT